MLKLLPQSSRNTQLNLFHSQLRDMLDSNDPLIALADIINWEFFDKSFAKYYSDEGRPAKPIRLMVGLLLLKQLENLSDENVVLQWKRNPYYQYFCGMTEYVPALPCDATELVKFRQRIGTEGVESIFAMSVALHGKDAQEKQVIIDTTVQEKNVTYPTDGKLAIKMIHHLHKIAKEEKIQLRRTYVKEIKGHRISLRFFRHPKKIKKARAAMKRLGTIVGILIRDISRNLNDAQLEKHKEAFDLYTKVINQKRKDSNKVYSLHESHIYAIAKGKDHKKYEYGTKASLVTTMKSNVIIGVTAHQKNEHDSKTLEAALAHANKHRTKPIIEAICDRGYRGKKEVNGTAICIPDSPKKRDTKYQKEQKRKKFRRRAAIEPIIGHVKSDHRMQRNYLKGFIGDQINLLLAAAAFNLKKWMNHFLMVLFLVKITYFTYFMLHIRAEERRKYADLYLNLMLYRLW
ncbi:IS5 family transposase [Sulfurovum lithotrophicum]|uniref:IS5 family transposase n=1 Tax=Sulfurovum lithotrophicum TaxID=206403 RepID=UPI0024818128|nr:IS5 family transposase [Sulfurovum lithotrophicum]